MFKCWKNLALDLVKMKLVSSSFFHFVDVYGALPVVSTMSSGRERRW